jgi:thioredoxin-like negative regulator of GroEL
MAVTSTEELDAQLDGERLVLVNVTYPPSENPRMAAVLAEIEARLSDRLIVLAVDVMAAPEVLQRLGVTTIPTWVVLAGGEPLAYIEPRNVSKERLVRMLEALVAT